MPISCTVNILIYKRVYSCFGVRQSNCRIFGGLLKTRRINMFKWIKKLFTRNPQHGMVTITCRECGKTFSLPEGVQYWPDLCQECRMKAPDQRITRKCRGCGRMFTFSSTTGRWPKYCRECLKNRRLAKLSR